MPHLIIERLRTCPGIFTRAAWPERKSSRLATYLIEVLDIAAALIFIAGSICFLPFYAANLQVFFLGCFLFIVGSLLYCIICMFTFGEAYSSKGSFAFEVWENGLYLAGSILFLIGSVLYLPPEDQAKAINKIVSLGQICDEFSYLHNQLLGTVLFIVGSVLFIFAAFTNLMSEQKGELWSIRLLKAVTSCYMGGSLLFALGSVAFLPHLGCGEHMVMLGAWCFIIGSALFLLGSVVSMARTVWVLNGPEAERLLPPPPEARSANSVPK